MNKITGIQANSQGIFTVNANRIGRLDADNLQKEDGSKKKSSTVFAGDLNMVQDSILAKKQRAQKEAMKMLKDVFDADMKTDAEQKAREQHIEEMKQQNEKAKSGLKDIEDMQDHLMEQYGLTQDCQEQKDLELVRKIRNSKDPFAKDKLSKEEQERYEKITGQGLTEYQERVLSLDEAAEELQGVMADNEREIAIEENTIENTDMQRMKKHPMKDAAKNAAKHLEAATKDMIYDLYNESKEHIDEKAEEAKEEQKEKAEEKKEEEKEEAVREVRELEREIMLQKAQGNTQEQVEEQAVKAKNQGQVSMQNQINGDILGEISDGVDKSAEIDQKIKDLLDKLSLLQEDLKGVAVNDTV